MDGFVILEETSKTGHKVELPTKNSMAEMKVEINGHFAPLSFKAYSKDGNEKLFVNGKEELKVALEAMSPFWLVVHKQGQ